MGHDILTPPGLRWHPPPVTLTPSSGYIDTCQLRYCPHLSQARRLQSLPHYACSKGLLQAKILCFHGRSQPKTVANAKVAAGGGYGFSILMQLACTMASPAIWEMGAEYHAVCREHGTPTVSYGLYQPSPTSSVFFLIVIINTLVLPFFRVCSYSPSTCNP